MASSVGGAVRPSALAVFTPSHAVNIGVRLNCFPLVGSDNCVKSDHWEVRSGWVLCQCPFGPIASPVPRVLEFVPLWPVVPPQFAPIQLPCDELCGCPPP
jgi:hypothetical protein